MSRTVRYRNGLYAERGDNGTWTVRLSPNGEEDGTIIGRVRRSRSQWEASPFRLPRPATKSTLSEAMDYLKACHER